LTIRRIAVEEQDKRHLLVSARVVRRLNLHGIALLTPTAVARLAATVRQRPHPIETFVRTDGIGPRSVHDACVCAAKGTRGVVRTLDLQLGIHLLGIPSSGNHVPILNEINQPTHSSIA
jgi:hypothetical protein